VVIVSDHGFQALTSVTDRAPRTIADVGREEHIIKASGLMERLRLPEQKILMVKLGRGVYLRVKTSDKQEEGILIDRTVELLRDSFVLETNEPLFDISMTDSHSIRVRVRTDLEVESDTKIRLSDSECRLRDITEGHPRISGTHALDGIIIMSGENIRKGTHISNASVLDVTPTILALLGIPVAQDMDGRVLSEAISPEWQKRNPITYIASYDTELADEKPSDERLMDDEETAKIKEKLKGLGYL